MLKKIFVYLFLFVTSLFSDPCEVPCTYDPPTVYNRSDDCHDEDSVNEYSHWDNQPVHMTLTNSCTSDNGQWKLISTYTFTLESDACEVYKYMGSPNGITREDKTCPDGMVSDGCNCVCPSGKEKISVTKCPCDMEPCQVPVCADPCPQGTQRNEFGGCCYTGMIGFCDGSESGCRCPYDKIPDENGTGCITCDNTYPNADSTDCSNCPPYWEMPDGTCTNDGCSDYTDENGTTYPFYYPVSESSKFIVVGGDQYCYSAGTNQNTGTGGSSGDSGSGDGSGGDNNDSGSGSSGGSGSGDNNDSGSGDGSGSSGGSSGGGSSGSGSGTSFDDTNIVTALHENKSAIGDVKTSVDQANQKLGDIKTSVDQGNQKLGDIKTAIESSNQKIGDIKTGIDDLNDKLKSDGSGGYFDGLMNTANALGDSYTATKQNFENLVTLFKNGFETTTISGGNTDGFTFDVWDKQVNVNICQYTGSFAPIVAFMIQLSMLFASIRLFIWGIKH